MSRRRRFFRWAALGGLPGLSILLAWLWLGQSLGSGPLSFEPALSLSLSAWREADPTLRRTLSQRALDSWTALERGESRGMLAALGHRLGCQAAADDDGSGFWTSQHTDTVRLMFSAWLEEEIGQRGEAWTRVHSDRLGSLRHAFIFQPGGHLPKVVDLLSDPEQLQRGLPPNGEHQLAYHLLGPLFSQRRIEDMDRSLSKVLASLQGQRWAAIGAGLGPEALWISESAGVPCTIQDIEPAFEPFWAFCEGRVSALRGRERVFGGPSETGLSRRTYDGIILCEVLHTFYSSPDPGSAAPEVRPWLRSIKAALRPGGRLVLIEESLTFKTLEGPVALLREAGFSEIVIHDEGYRFLVAQAP